MGTRLACCVIGLCIWGAALAADSSTVRPGTSVATVRPVQANLSAVAKRSLAGRITRGQQMQVLLKNPATAARLQALGTNTQTKPMNSDPWQTGITLTPLLPVWPAGSTTDTYALSLQSTAIAIDASSPLPSASQTPPLLWFFADSDSRSLFAIAPRWPSAGAYVVTLFMRLWPGEEPRVGSEGSEVTVVPNADAYPDRFTFLWEAQSGSHMNDSIPVRPTAGSGYAICCLSKIVVSKLP